MTEAELLALCRDLAPDTRIVQVGAVLNIYSDDVLTAHAVVLAEGADVAAARLALVGRFLATLFAR